MRYLMFVVVDPAAQAEAEADPRPDRMSIDDWVARNDEAGRRIVGERLRPPDAATGVRLSHGEVVVTDGPFTESKEWIAGFDILECADLDEAIAVAADHPMANGGKLELRPFWPFEDES